MNTLPRYMQSFMQPSAPAARLTSEELDRLATRALWHQAKRLYKAPESVRKAFSNALVPKVWSSGEYFILKASKGSLPMLKTFCLMTGTNYMVDEYNRVYIPQDIFV